MEESSSLWTPPVLDLSVDRYAAGKSWKPKWNDYFIAKKLSEKPAKHQSAILQYSFTDKIRKTFETLSLQNNRLTTVTVSLA